MTVAPMSIAVVVSRCGRSFSAKARLGIALPDAARAALAADDGPGRDRRGRRPTDPDRVECTRSCRLGAEARTRRASPIPALSTQLLPRDCAGRATNGLARVVDCARRSTPRHELRRGRRPARARQSSSPTIATTAIRCCPCRPMSTSSFAYGPGSAARHEAEARRHGLDVQVVRDPALGFDVDTPADLAELSTRRTRRPRDGLRRPPDCPDACSRSARIPTTSNSAAAPRSRSGPTRVPKCISASAPTARRERGTATPTSRHSSLAAKRNSAPPRPSSARPASEFLRFVDGELEDTPIGARRGLRVIRRVRPDVVLGHDPWRPYRMHPDHRNAGLLTAAADRRCARSALLPRAGRRAAPTAHAAVLRAGTRRRTSSVCTTTSTARSRALLAHRSQWRSTMGIDERR